MRIPANAVIPREKLTDYLLVPRPTNDKSRYLGLGGFDLTNVDRLESEIRRLALESDGVISRVNQHGVYYTVTGELLAPNGAKLRVRLIWIERLDGITSFVTLVPDPAEA